jgi:hypothetical protein
MTAHETCVDVPGPCLCLCTVYTKASAWLQHACLGLEPMAARQMCGRRTIRIGMPRTACVPRSTRAASLATSTRWPMQQRRGNRWADQVGQLLGTGARDPVGKGSSSCPLAFKDPGVEMLRSDLLACCGFWTIPTNPSPIWSSAQPHAGKRRSISSLRPHQIAPLHLHGPNACTRTLVDRHDAHARPTDSHAPAYARATGAVRACARRRGRSPPAGANIRVRTW